LMSAIVDALYNAADSRALEINKFFAFIIAMILLLSSKFTPIHKLRLKK